MTTQQPSTQPTPFECERMATTLLMEYRINTRYYSGCNPDFEIEISMANDLVRLKQQLDGMAEELTTAKLDMRYLHQCLEITENNLHDAIMH